MVKRNFLFRVRNIWLNSVLFALAFICQMPIQASDQMAASNYEMMQPVSGQDSTRSQGQLSFGKLSRRAKAAQRRISVRSAEVILVDTSAATLAAIRALPRDSSARIAQFQYVRRDFPAVDGSYHKVHPMFLGDPAIVKHQAILDSSKWVYRLCETVNNNYTRIPTEIPLEEYSSLRLRQAVRNNWESMAQFYLVRGETKTTLGDVLGKITKIEVPVPKNPIFSIFGPNIIKLTINGGVDINAGFVNTKSDLFSADPLANNRTEPSFKQEIQVNVKGEIGDKLSIDADWNTQRTFEYENQLHVKYKGYDDEIVQSVEAGNVSLPTNSSFFSGGQALFGILAKFQVGPLRLTTVATQKKGQIKQISISGGGQSAPFDLRPSNYSQNHFFIDTSYISLYERMYYKIPAEPIDSMTIREIEVYVTSTSQIDQMNDKAVIAYMDQNTVMRMQNDSIHIDPSPELGENEIDRFTKLNPSQYDVDLNAGIISLRATPRDDQAVAVYYVARHSDGSLKIVGNSSQITTNDKKYVLKLIRPKNLSSRMKAAWRLMLKNHYNLGVVGIKQESFTFNIEYQLSGQNPVQQVFPQNIGLLEIFGLDRFSGDNSSKPDNVFDYNKGLTVDETYGEVIFPTVEPFDKSNIARFLHDLGGINEPDLSKYADSLSFRAIYDTSANVAMYDPKNLYHLRGTVKGSGQSKFPLNAFNIVEGSVKVTSGGQLLTPGVDYTVDYISSKVEIKNQAYLVAGRDIQISYEANDMFQLASKSLLGTRAELDLGKNSLFGFTIMNYSEQSLSDKVRLGEEPISNTIMGIDGSTIIDAPWLTKGLDYIPGLQSTAPSQITLRGELAYMSPNPNTRSSPISSDGGKGVAYIDDFEGTKQIIPLGTDYHMWKEASAPWFIPNLDRLNPNTVEILTSTSLIANGDILADSVKMKYKGHGSWFDVIPSDVSIPTIWGDRKSYAQGEGLVTVLNFYFRPQDRGTYNYSMDLEHTIGLDSNDASSHTKAWAGCQHIIGSASTNLVDQNIAFIELWVNIVSSSDPNAKLNIDLGYISEDVIPNRKLNTEDGLDSPSHIPRGIMNPQYDWGLDTMSNEMEQNYYTANGFLVKYPRYRDDPSGDNWKKPPTWNGQAFSMAMADIYDGVDGTEGNYIDGQVPDGEDLNRNNNIDLLNSYFEYEIPLDVNNPAFAKLKTGEGQNNWYQIRIPLSDYNRRIGGASLTSVEGVRLWVTGAGSPVLFRIAEFNLVGNQWEKVNRTDSSYEVSVVNFEDNPEYTSPPGVVRQKDLSRPDQNILGNEQALNIIVKNLHDSDSKEAVKHLVDRPLDMFNYKTLKMFVHGETGNIAKNYTRFKDDGTSAEVFLRFGDDTLNYYEYCAPVYPGWVGNDITIKFSDLTPIKSKTPDSLNENMKWGWVPGGSAGAKYQVRGDPRLDRIQFISIGIRNPKGKGDSVITGELWTNELRLTDVDDTPGWAYKFDTNIKLADFGNISFSITQRDPFFHGLEERFGSRNTSTSWNIAASFSVSKLLPESWNGSGFDFSYSHSESMNKARYIPGKDILVDQEANLIASQNDTSSTRTFKNADDVHLKSEDLSVTNSYSAQNIHTNIPLKTWLVTETINKMSFGYTYSITHQRSPTIEYSEAWSWNAMFRYGTQFSQNNYISLWSMKIFYTPKQFDLGATLSRNQSISKPREQTESPVAHNLNAQRSMNFNWQFFDGGLYDLGLVYNVSISSSLYDMESDSRGNLRPFSDILGDIFFNKHIVNFGVDRTYGQAIILNTKMTAPHLFNMDKIFAPNFQYSVNYNWANNPQAGDLGRTAGWSGGPRFMLDITLKPIADAIWPTTPAAVDTGSGKKLGNSLKQLGAITRILFKVPFFDFDKFSISFNQSNSSQNNGVRGSSGFANLFARVPFFQSSIDENGPSMWYQLGLSTDPNGTPVLKTKSKFPFITGFTEPGLRAPGAQINDNYSQNNQVTLQTSRALWDGATLRLDWKVAWSYSENKTSYTDSTTGAVTPNSTTVSGDVSRSYISLPSGFGFSVFNTNLENVNKKYEAMKGDDNDLRPNAEKLSQSFEEGLEAFPWLTKILGTLAPRANWSFHWTGLEKFSLLKSFTSMVSLDHSYSSDYRRRWQFMPTIDPVTSQSSIAEVTQSQTVTYEFSPLIGVNITFKELFKGTLSTIFRYGVKTTYDLSPSIQNVSQTGTSDISVTGTYSRQGFEIPLFGISLMNNIDFSFTYGYSHNTRLLFDFNDFQKDGLPMEGSTRTSMEPRIRYTLSDRISASLFYRYTKLEPDKGGSSIPGSTVTEGGVDVHISIQ